MSSLLASVVRQGQRFVFTEHEAGGLRLRYSWLRPESGHALECRRVGRSGFQRGQFKLRSRAMLCAHLHKRVKRARRHVQSEPLLKEARNIAVGLSLPAQFANQVSMGFQLGAWRFGRKVGKPGKNDLRISIRCGRKRMHRYPAGRLNRRLTTMSRSLGGSLGTSLGDPKIGRSEERRVGK